MSPSPVSLSDNFNCDSRRQQDYRNRDGCFDRVIPDREGIRVNVVEVVSPVATG
ncbi:MAG: hypothetical protein ACTSYM_03245 [Candidatus Baldrarchaeia archaeon]